MSAKRPIFILCFVFMILGAGTPTMAATYTTDWSGSIFAFEYQLTNITTLDIRPGGFDPNSHAVTSASLSMVFQDDWSGYDGVEKATIYGDSVVIASNLVFGEYHSGTWTWSTSLTDLGNFSDGLLNIKVYNPTPHPNDFYVKGVSLTTTWEDKTLAPVPIPPAVILFGSGLIGLIGYRRKR